MSLAPDRLMLVLRAISSADRWGTAAVLDSSPSPISNGNNLFGQLRVRQDLHRTKWYVWWGSSGIFDPYLARFHRRIRQELFPSCTMSPADDSMANSSSRVPTRVPSGSRTTSNSAVSGMAPPEVSAARRPRRARRDWVVASQCSRPHCDPRGSRCLRPT